MKKTVAYIRVSTDGQIDGAGLDTQKECIEAFCISQGWTLDAIYTDPGHSGATMDRPGLVSLRAAIDAGDIERVVVHKLDRLSRRLLHLKMMVDDELTPAGVAIASVREKIDTATPAGRLFFNMLGSFAEFEREVITERLDAGRRTRARQGSKAAGAVPFGYRRTAAGTVEPDPDTAETVRHIFKTYLKTGSLGKLKNELDTAGIHNERGKPFTRQALAYMLKNEFYIGKIEYGDIKTGGAHQAIITPHTFRKVGRALAAGNKRRNAA
jgi:site-specific DNA recombinase